MIEDNINNNNDNSMIPIVVTLVGIVTDVSDAQRANAKSPDIFNNDYHVKRNRMRS